jgi:CRISPR-associated endonuclease/helicase Cas3
MAKPVFDLRECLSHPDQPLATHLLAVTEAIAAEPPVRVGDDLQQAILASACLCGLLHDTGKATRFFQEYIRGGRDAGRLRHHAHLSALFAHVALPDLLAHFDLSDDLHTLLTCAGTLSVWRHHGDLYDFEDMAARFIDDTQRLVGDDVLPRQLAAMPVDQINEWLKEQWPRFELPGSWKSVEAADLLAPLDGFGLRRQWRKMARRQSEGMDRPISLLMHHALLIGHDKLQAALREEKPSGAVTIESRIIEDYRMTQFGPPQSKMDLLRESMCRSASDSLRDNLQHRVFTLTAPTGSGKTLTGLEAALQLQERKRAQYPNAPIIYCLPFTSIIDQNFEVITDVLDKSGIAPTSDLLLKHHHLADGSYATSEREYDLDASSLLTEEWMSAVVVTTFEQFFRTLYQARNASLKRFHRLRGSVILLDEVQAIPRRYWETVRLTLLQLAQDWDVDVLLMTATRPLIFEESDRTELVGNQEELFGGLSRVVLSNRSGEETELQDFLLEVEDQITAEPDRSVGIVCNTVACARRVYQHLSESFDRPCTYLSSQIVPCDRRERIRRLRQGAAPGLLVSTQVIEAGVDISLDVIHRDFAPLDSIIQTAGRCNRNAEAEGKVVLWKLVDSERYRRPFCEMIYDALLLDSTKRVLDERDTIPEAQFRQLGDEYFEDLKRRGADSELHREFAMLNFGTVAEKFQLIEELPGRQSYFVMLDDEAEHLWETYCSLQELTPLERRRKFMEIKRPFYERIINVARPEGEATEDVEPLYLDSDMGAYYDTEVGFQEVGANATAFF